MRDDYLDYDQPRKIKLAKIDVESRTLLSYLTAYSPVDYIQRGAFPADSIAHHLVLKDNEPHFIASFNYKVMLLKVDFDGTVKWKVVASVPGPPVPPNATVLASWGVNERERRMDIVLAEQQFAYPIVINTWNEEPGEWDGVVVVENDPSMR